jgi:hypothetical protein
LVQARQHGCDGPLCHTVEETFGMSIIQVWKQQWACQAVRLAKPLGNIPTAASAASLSAAVVARWAAER